MDNAVNHVAAALLALLVSGPLLAQEQPLPPALLDRVEGDYARLLAIMNERDRLYSERYASQQSSVAAALASAEKAVAKAEDAANKRFDSVNEFRETLTDQATRFAGKLEVDVRFKSIEDRLADIALRQERIMAEANGASNLWTLLGGGVLLILAVAGFAMNFIRRPAPSKA